jgi:hypothetical protein
MNTDRAYLFGLIIGGGVFGDDGDILRIKLPFKKWGSYLENPQRVGQISRDIMNVVSPMFRNIYNMIVSFEATENIWHYCAKEIQQTLRQISQVTVFLARGGSH